ncbi:MAG: UDP-N-acetylglucosamine 2-epimerase (non-hydrolyzing) [Bacteroidales bacterium]|nr:UDP-N-acetylglucosamine 2-epimerase (non-hydrolyzing) [Bacteroidales bacterium]
MKIVTVIGARPQIIKAAALSRAIKEHFENEVQEVIVHTGQHYDDNMSQVFFDELGLPQPNYNLNVGSASHGVQTAKMIVGIEEILLKEKPDYLVLYGDTNSTLAGAIAASKIHVPIVHIEAGLRSFNKSMPEEINRICCDHCSTLLFSPTATGYQNLINEGFSSGIYHCGDVMYDNSKYFANIADKKSQILDKEELRGVDYVLCTIHRDNNTDQPERLNAIFKALLKISESKKVVLPLHPRTSKLLNVNLEKDLFDKISNNKNIKILPPASFLDMIVLERHAQMIVTDSGGVQKEAFFFQKPCLILRTETEWTEIVECGAAVITDANEERIIESFNNFMENAPHNYPDIFGDGNAAVFICKEMLEKL